MNYSQTIEYIFNRTNFEQLGRFTEPLKLDKVIQAAVEMGNPHQSFRSIHVAGTNGKGSVTHCLSAILQQNGYKVGLFTSPHLVDFCERIKINGQPCTQDFVIQFVARQKKVIEQYRLSFFEITTLMAFSCFAEQNIDIAVIETGLGGRLDATNIIIPTLSIITNIGLEHTEILGNTVEEIAVEKGGIIKHGIPVIYGGNNIQVQEVLQKIADDKQSVLLSTQEIVTLKLIEELPSFRFKITGCELGISEISTDLKGQYQIDNIATTLAACQVLMKEGIDISLDSITKGLQHVTTLTRFYGRWQTISLNPTVIVDVAHNPEGIAAVSSALQQLATDRLTIIFGVVKDKNFAEMLRQLPSNCQLIFTEIQSQRSAKKSDIEPLITPLHFNKVNYVSSIAEAFEVLSENIRQNTTVIIGSNYLAGEALQYFTQKYRK